MESTLRTTKEDGIALVTLNRPSAYNALNVEMIQALAENMVALSLDDAVKAVVITGEGKAFCAGGDLKAIQTYPAGMSQGVYALATFFHQAVQEIRRMTKPVIAAINGVAAGGGFSLALSCDFRVMAQSAALKQAYTSSGLSLDGGGSFILPRLVGLARAMEIVAFDEAISPGQALSWGLVTEVAEDGGALEAAKKMALALTKGALHAFGTCKALLTGAYETGLEVQLQRERLGISRCVAHPEGQEGIKAFIEKRRPVFGD